MSINDQNNLTLSIADMESNISNESMAKEKIEAFDPRVNIRIISYRKRKHDPDGISAKAVLDGIVRTGILSDDSTNEIKSITFESRQAKTEKTIIEITGVDDDKG